jgi:hypothetical protein
MKPVCMSSGESSSLGCSFIFSRPARCALRAEEEGVQAEEAKIESKERGQKVYQKKG